MTRSAPKILPTVLGMLLLAGGIGAGVILMLNPQLLGSRAVQPDYSTIKQCPTSGVICSSSPIVGASQCADSGRISYCCSPNEYISFGKCISSTDTCGNGVICSASPLTGGKSCVSGGKSWSCCGFNEHISNGKCVADEPLIDCGNHGIMCAKSDCHCQGGDACTDKRCESGTHQSCLNQGRSWCINMQNSGGYTCCVAGYVCGPSPNNGCVPGGTSSTPPKTTPPQPSSTPITPVAQCLSTKIYSPGWTLVSATTFSTFKAGDQVYFCTTGTTNSTTGSFDKARFTINGKLMPETTLKRPGSNDFCYLYTIPSALYNFTVQGEIHHTVLGWQ